MTEPQRRAAVQLVGGATGSPLVSVLIVNYNYGAFLAAALDSALAQTYPPHEILVCGDGSTAHSPIVIERYARRHPDVVRPVFKPNGGVASALNAAFEHSRGDIICFLDADDLFTPDKLAKVVAAFGPGQQGIGIVVNSLGKLRSSGEVAGLIPQFGRLDRGWLRDKILATGGHWSYVPTTGISLSRPCAEGLFPIPEDEFRTEADSYMYTQAPLFWAVGAIDEPVSVLRLHTSNITSSEGMTVAYARRVTASIERMCRALERTAGAHPYLTTPEHTRNAREILGEAPLLAPEQKVVVDTDGRRARALGRRAVSNPYLKLTNYVANLKRLGYSDDDLAADGSDRLVDALAPHGEAEQLAGSVTAHLEAGANHVCVQVLGDDPMTGYRALAQVLL
jgi:hypothetical protein